MTTTTRTASSLLPSTLALAAIAFFAGTPTASAGIEFQGIEFQGIEFQGIEFQGIEFQGIEFQGELLGAKLSGNHILASTLADLPVEDLALEGTRWVGEVGGVELGGAELIDMTWTAPSICDQPGCPSLTLRVADVMADASTNTMVANHVAIPQPALQSNSDIFLYKVEVESAPGVWSNVCGEGSDIYGTFARGKWTDAGDWSDQGVTFSCTTGVIAKCMRSWGYKPWKTLNHDTWGPVSLHELHLTCTRAARADYCGDGVSHTENGNLIDVADSYGFNRHVSTAAYDAFVAGTENEGTSLSVESVFTLAGALEVAYDRATGVYAGDWENHGCGFDTFSVAPMMWALQSNAPALLIRSILDGGE